MPYVHRRSTRSAQLGGFSFTDLLKDAGGVVQSIESGISKVGTVATAVAKDTTTVNQNLPNIAAVLANPKAAAGGAVATARFLPYIEGLGVVAAGALLVHLLTGRHNGRRRR